MHLTEFFVIAYSESRKKNWQRLTFCKAEKIFFDKNSFIVRLRYTYLSYSSLNLHYPGDQAGGAGWISSKTSDQFASLGALFKKEIFQNIYSLFNNAHAWICF